MQIVEFLGSAPLASTTGFVAIALLLWVLRGLVPMLFYRQRRLAWHLALATVLLLAGGAGRSLYWDGLAALVQDDPRRTIRAALGGLEINALFNGLLIWSALHWLRVLHLLIPDGERSSWTIWTAPCWPTRVAWPAICDHLRDSWRNRRR